MSGQRDPPESNRQREARSNRERGGRETGDDSRHETGDRDARETDDRHDVRPTLEDTLAYARERDYTGWDLYDGESSRILRALPVESKWLNLAFQQSVRRSPVNVRPVLLVEQRPNPMGTALFSLANLTAYDVTSDERYRADARRLADWVVENQVDGYGGFCVGHSHPLQGLSKRTTPDIPGVVGTSWATKALIAAGDRFDGPYHDAARSAADFVFETLDYGEAPTGARINYKAIDTGDHYTLNANALGARLLVDLYDAFGDATHRARAERILEYVAAQQTDRGGWMYRDPPEASHLSMDNFHNGFIVQSFLRYRETCDHGAFATTVDDAVAFYRELFTADGAPHFDESNVYPRDIHSSAQGIVVFSMLGEFDRAERILGWAREHLSDGDGRFFHEQRRLYTNRTTLMRWCQAWMAYAMGEYLRRSETAAASGLRREERCP